MGKLYNLARMTTATTGTGTVTLGSAVAGYLSFASAGISNAETVTYAIKDGSNSEIGRGVYTSSGTTLTRSVLRSTNSNNAINLSGSAEVFITPAAEDLLIMAQPGGRLTLTTATPVLTSTVTSQTTVFYTPYAHRFVPLFDGTTFNMHDIGGELSQATTDSTKSPSAVTTNSNYDVFVWLDGSTYRATRGPAWSSDTSRGTGAGTSELERVQGVWLNKVAITNGPAANRGTYVGTIRTNGSSAVDFSYGGIASGGSAALFGLWNAYNRVNVTTMVGDSDNFWTYTTAAWRPYNNSSNNRVSFLRGLDEDAMNADFTGWADAGISSNIVGFAVGLDSTSAFTGQSAGAQLINSVTFGVRSMSTAKYAGLPGIGWHYVQALEYCQAGTCTFLGDGGTSPVIVQTGMTVTLRA